jgi:hypothetical protein
MAFTSDGQPRSNIAAMALAIMPSIPYMIDWSARVTVLHDLATAVNENGGNIPVIAITAAYDNSGMTQRINDISKGLNTMGAAPPLPIYESIDINSFNSVVGNIVEVMSTMQ